MRMLGFCALYRYRRLEYKLATTWPLPLQTETLSLVYQSSLYAFSKPKF